MEDSTEVASRKAYHQNLGEHGLTSDHVPQGSSSPLPDFDFASEPFHLSLPTLNTDGSIDDLTAHESRHHTRTPPAALSTLGARIKMEQRSNRDNMSDSTSSFEDGQYDMIDDLSEISNDDHETASVASGTDEQRTPADTDSEEGSMFLVDDQDQPSTPPRPTSAQSAFYLPFGAQAAGFHEGLVQSYASEDLETPRQSTLTDDPAAARRSTLVPSDSQAFQPDKEANHILFVAEEDVDEGEMHMICIRLASAMDSSTINSHHHVDRWAGYHSGIEGMPPTAVYANHQLSATAEHCIDAESRMGRSNSWQLRVMDADRFHGHSSIYTVGDHGKIDLRKPDVAVIFLDDGASNKRWYDSAYRAMRSLNVPVLVVHKPSVDHPLINKKQPLKEVLTMADLALMDRSALEAFIKRLRGGELSKLARSKGQGRARAYWATLAPFISFIVLWTFAILQSYQKQDAVLTLSHRREGLLAAMTKTTNSANGKELDIEHLLPECWSNDPLKGPVSVGQCKEPIATMQHMLPNHLIVSLSPDPRHPKVISTKMYRKDGRALEFNHTKLIEGVYDFALPTEEATGSVFLNIMTSHPERNITASHDFGRRLLQRRTYEKASTDVSKDIAVMRTTAKTITSKLSTEVGAGVWATKNVTSQLALHMSKELQTIGNKALSIFGKAAHAGNQTATTITKDFVLIQNDLVKFTKDLSTLVKSKVEAAKSTSKELIKKPLVQSRQRLMDIKNAIQRSKHVKNVEEPIISNEEEYARAVNAHKSLKQRINHLSARVKKLRGQEGPRAGLKQLKKQLREHEKTIKSYEESAQKSYEEAMRKKKELVL